MAALTSLQALELLKIEPNSGGRVLILGGSGGVSDRVAVNSWFLGFDIYIVTMQQFTIVFCICINTGTGSMGVQIAAAALGMKVTTTSSQIEFVIKLGAERVLLHSCNFE